MTELPVSRRRLLEGAGVLVVGFSIGATASAVRAADFASRSVEPESLDSWLAIACDGSVTAYTGRVDLGTGTETALTQMIADELDVPANRVRVVMGDTRLTPNQGKTTAGLNMVRGSQPLRVAAAEARAALIALAVERLGVAAADLKTADGYVLPKFAATGGLSYGELIGDRSFSVELEVANTAADDVARGIMLKPKAPLKAFKDYKVIGTSVLRIDIPAKIAGSFEFVHNVRVPGMLHGRVVRPPAFGARLLAVENDSIRGIPDAHVVRRNDFLGVVAPREEDAIKAALVLKADWSRSETLPDIRNLYDELRRRPVISDEFGYNEGDISAGLSAGKIRLKSNYHFPFQDHAMIGPSCAVADVKSDRAVIWSGSQWPQGDRGDLAKMLGLALDRVHVIWREGSGSYGRLAADDAAADAAFMSQIVGRPVRVQWSRSDEHGWEPVSPAMAMTIEGACDETGRLTAFDYVQYSSTHSMGERGNHIAWHLIGGAPGTSRSSGGATNLLYDVKAKRVRNVYVEPWLRAVYLRTPGGIQSIFAYESFIAELAVMAGIDPLEMRLKNTSDTRDHDVLKAVARLSAWEPRRTLRNNSKDSAILTGRGLALARYGAGSKRELVNESRSALVVDVEVERASGKVAVKQAFMAFDCGLVINPDGALNQVEGGLLQGISRTLHEQVRFDRAKVTSLDWMDYRILTFTDVPEVKVEFIPRPDQTWSQVGEAGTVATAAAVANAVFDATGKHPRRLPLEPDYIRTLL